MRNEYDQADVARVLDGLAGQIAGAFAGAGRLNLVGIRSRGDVVAKRLAERLRKAGFGDLGEGVLDITLYRDDLSEIGPRPLVRPTNMDLSLDDVPLVLVDDVLFTGRSVRAAMDALADFGRPSVVRLAVLADRGGRELPIQADFVGLKLGDVPRSHRVNVMMQETDGVDAVKVEPRT